MHAMYLNFFTTSFSQLLIIYTHSFVPVDSCVECWDASSISGQLAAMKQVWLIIWRVIIAYCGWKTLRSLLLICMIIASYVLIETEIGGSLLSACRLFYLSYCYVTLHGHGEWWCITLLLIIFIISLIMIQIAASIQKSSLQGTLSPILVQMLVDMHLFCASRHPLQRSIARYATWVMVVTIIRDI